MLDSATYRMQLVASVAQLRLSGRKVGGGGGDAPHISGVFRASASGYDSYYHNILCFLLL